MINCCLIPLANELKPDLLTAYLLLWEYSNAKTLLTLSPHLYDDIARKLAIAGELKLSLNIYSLSTKMSHTLLQGTLVEIMKAYNLKYSISLPISSNNDELVKEIERIAKDLEDIER